MNYNKAHKYSKEFIQENIMGPNPMKLLEELMEKHPLPKGATVMDLGCGRGVTSIFLAKEYGLHVFATDLWISPTENKQRFDQMGLTKNEIIPIKGEAHDLPYAEEFFDAVISIDSYHYFGLDKHYLGKHLLPLVKHGGHLLLVVPGFKQDIHHNLPEEFFLSWTAEDLETFHDCAYWRNILEYTKGIEIISIEEMEGNEECWNDWHACENEYAVGDRKAMNAGAGKYMNFIAMVLRRK